MPNLPSTRVRRRGEHRASTKIAQATPITVGEVPKTSKEGLAGTGAARAGVREQRAPGKAVRRAEGAGARVEEGVEKKKKAFLATRAVKGAPTRALKLSTRKRRLIGRLRGALGEGRAPPRSLIGEHVSRALEYCALTTTAMSLSGKSC